jgi:hypothetical protein
VVNCLHYEYLMQQLSNIAGCHGDVPSVQMWTNVRHRRVLVRTAARAMTRLARSLVPVCSAGLAPYVTQVSYLYYAA